MSENEKVADIKYGFVDKHAPTMLYNSDVIPERFHLFLNKKDALDNCSVGTEIFEITMKSLGKTRMVTGE